MEIAETLKLSTAALKRNKSRSFLTMLGVIIGVFSVITLVSLGTGLKNYITQQFEALGANSLYIMPGKFAGEGEGFSFGAPPNYSGSKLKNSLVEEIQKLGEPITDATGYIEVPGLAKFRQNQIRVTVSGASPKITSFVIVKMKEGRFFNTSEVITSRQVAVIGAKVAEELYQNKESLGEEIIISDSRFKVIGVLESMGTGMIGGEMDKVVFIPYTASQKVFDIDSLQTIMVKFSDKDRYDEAKFKIKSLLLRTLDEEDFSIINQGSILSTISSILQVLTVALGGIAAISLLVGGIGIMNIMLVSVTERTREIGVRKAVGAKNTDILGQFLAEAVFLSLVGGLVGVALGVLGALVVSQLISASAFSWWSVLLALGVSCLVGIVFGVMPAAKAAKLDPVEALRYE
ncbi:MAG TPA: ABC transporter permease [Clostridia bacterium]|nr:ABC transporter permease [Clostridia bacterium]